MAKHTGHTITSDSALGSAVIERSLRFNKAQYHYLTRTPSSTGNQKIWTFSAWIKRTNLSNNQHYIYTAHSGSTYFSLYFENDNLHSYFSPGNNYGVINDREFRDSNSWLHLVHQVDATNTTQRVWINNEELTLNSSRNPGNSNYPMNESGVAMVLGTASWWLDNNASDMYLAEVNYIDGSLIAPTEFAFTEPQTGIWMPKRYEGTYGTNGYRLDFSDNTSTTTLGIDKSPNGNDFTLTNFSVSDSVKDTPTNAFATLNANVYADSSFNEGALYFDSADTHKTAYSNIAVSSGKWYWETKAIAGSTTKWTYGVSDVNNIGVGQISGSNRLLAVSSGSPSDGSYSQGDAVSIYNTKLYKNGSVVTDSYQTTPSTGDIIGVALDVDAGKVWFARNGTWINGSATASTTLNPASHDTTVTTGETYVPAISGESADWQLNFGQDDSFSGTSTSQGNEDENGLGSFYYAVPSGFRALCTKNLPRNVSSIIRPQKHFDCLTYSGTGSSNSITGLEFSPDLVWAKRRDTGGHHHLFVDTLRGGSKSLQANTADPENSNANRDMTFLANGFRWNSNTGNANASGGTYVSWCWKAGGAAVSNTDGSVTSTVSANPEAGFSIVQFEAQTTNINITVGHGLGRKPAFWMWKSIDNTIDWYNYHKDIGYNGWLNLSTNSAATTGNDAAWKAEPTSTVLTHGSGLVNQNTIIMYVWAEIPGYSKFGTYTGNGNSNGSYVHLGFRPALVLFKSRSNSENWQMKDNKRVGYNELNHTLFPNNDNSEYTTAQMDFLSNGFKLRNGGGGSNGDGETLVYMAWAEQPGTTPFDTFPNAR
jgi:hypothetical protein